MELHVQTTDARLHTLSIPCDTPITLFRNVTLHCTLDGPLDILVDSRTLEAILKFTARDHPADIACFTPGDKAFLSQFTTDEVIEICKGANYLGYEFLLEVSAAVIADFFRHCETSELNRLFAGNESGEEMANEFDWLPDENEE